MEVPASSFGLKIPSHTVAIVPLPHPQTTGFPQEETLLCLKRSFPEIEKTAHRVEDVFVLYISDTQNMQRTFTAQQQKRQKN